MATIGLDAELSYGDQLLDRDAGTPVTETDVSWSEITPTMDVTLGLDRNTSEVPTRGSTNFTERVVGLADGSIEFEMLYDTSDSAFSQLQTAYFDADPIALAAMDGPIGTSGSEGLAGNFYITDFSRSEPLEDGLTVSVTAVPESDVAWYTTA